MPRLADNENSGLSDMNSTQDLLKHISYGYIVTGSLSAIGSASIVVVAIVKKKICSQEIRPLFQLSLADLLASVLLLGTSILFNVLQHKHNNGTAFYCKYITGLIACFYVCTFLLTVTYAFEVYFKMRARLERRSELTVISSNFPILYFMYATSWLLPILTIGVSFAIESDDDHHHSVVNTTNICNVCLPVFHYSNKDCKSMSSKPAWNNVLTYLFLMCLLSSSCMLIVIYIIVLKTFKKAQLSRGVVSVVQHKEERRVRRTAILFQFAFIFCWLPSIVLGFLTLTIDDFSVGKYHAVYILQASISPLQGFLNCFIYGWKRKGFTKAISDSSGDNST